MGNSMGSLYKGAEERVKYMKSPDLTLEAAQEMVPEMVSEIGRHDYAGIVSIGPVGVGKSSNLNTIASFMANKLEQQAASGAGTGSLTKESTAHLISYQGRPVKWKWMDTPGDLFADLVELWKRMDLPEESSDHVSQEQYDAQIQELLISPLRQHHIGCVMAFLSAHELFANSIRTEVGNVIKMSAAPQSRLSFHLQVLKDLHQRLVQQGLRMVCIITKVDLIDPSIAEAVSNVTYSHDIYLCRQFVARDTGMPVNQVHPVVNLVTDFDPQDNLPLGHLALFNVRNALAAARHCDLPPPAPSTSHNRVMEWDTLTFPSRIASEDGMSGRSHPVNEAQSDMGTVEPSAAMNGHVRSVAPSMVTDLDQKLMEEGSEANA